MEGGTHREKTKSRGGKKGGKKEIERSAWRLAPGERETALKGGGSEDLG